MPTVRQVETPTVPGGVLPSVTPTVQVAAPTIASSPTLGAAAPTRRMDPAPPRSPSRDRRPARPAPPPPRPPAPQAAAALPAARKSGGGAGLIIGLGLAGLLGAVVLAGAGWYFFLRKPTTPVAEVSPTPVAPSPSAVPTPVPPPNNSLVATATPSTAPVTAPVTPPAVAAAATPVPTAPPTASTSGQQGQRLPPSTPRPAVVDNGGQEPGGRSFLDAEPEDGIDGRAAGEDLAGKYRSGQGSSGSSGSTSHFRPRDRSPRNLVPVERPAVATIRHIINAQEAYHRKRNRYGSLNEMAVAQSLFLDVPFQPTSFRRGGYNFDLTVEADGFRIVAMPTAPNGRPFIGDDSGIIRAGTE